MDTPDDFIEAEIEKILAILEKQCNLFDVDKKRIRQELKEAEEREPRHANR